MRNDDGTYIRNTSVYSVSKPVSIRSLIYACTIATVLDPRFKLAYYTADENSTDHVSTDEVFEKVDSVFRGHYQPSAAACDLETTVAALNYS